MTFFRKLLDFSQKLFFKKNKNDSSENSERVKFSDELEYVGVVQFQHQNFKNVKDFYGKILSIVKEAKEKGAGFLLFPAGMNIELYFESEEKLSENQISKIEDECLKVFSNIASNEKICLAYADIVKGQKLFHFLDNNGKHEDEDIFKIFNVKSAFLEKAHDVDLVLNPSAVKKWIGNYESFGHAWLYSQQEYVYSMESYMVGDHFIGQSGIYAPIEATESASGIIKQAQSRLLEEILIAKIDFSAIDDLKNKKNVKNEYERLFIER